MVYSQEIPENKYDTSVSYSSYREKLDNSRHSLYGLSYNKTNYLNAVYGNELQNGNIKYLYGFSLYYRNQIGKQFILDLEGFYNLLQLPNEKVNNYGGELSAGIILIPFSLKLTSIIQPYALVGFQQSLMSIESSTNEEIMKDLKDKTTNTSAPIWKAGIMIHFSKSIFLNAQYKQSISAANERNFNSWSAGIGYRR